MASTIWEFFGYRSDDDSVEARNAVKEEACPYVGGGCTKVLRDGTVAGVCSIKPASSSPVICCPKRLYADSYRVLRDVSERAFGPGYDLVAGPDAAEYVDANCVGCVGVFGKDWGKELRVPKRESPGSYFVDWVLVLLGADRTIAEFVAVEVQTIDTTGNYRGGVAALKNGEPLQKTSAGLNWENVNKRILPQLVYKGQVLQREELCKKGLFFVCPKPVYDKILNRLGGEGKLIRYVPQPAAITFMVYDLDDAAQNGEPAALVKCAEHTTTVYKVQEAFNNVTLPTENVYRDAIVEALGI